MSQSRLGIPKGTAPDEVAVGGLDRASHPDQFSMYFDEQAPLFSTLAGQLGGDAVSSIGARAQLQIRLTVSKNRDSLQNLGHIQAVWGFAKHLMGQPGALCVIDPQMSFRVHLPSAVASLDPARKFELKDHIFVVHETLGTEAEKKAREPYRAGGELVAFSHSRGMAKFGQPEILCRPTCDEPGAWQAAYRVIMELCERLAAGESPAHWLGAEAGVALNAGGAVWLEEYLPAQKGWPDVIVNGCGLVITKSTGLELAEMS